MYNKMKRKLLCLLLVLVLIMTGCGSSGEETSETTDTEEPTTEEGASVGGDHSGDLTPFEWYASSAASTHKGTPSAPGNSGTMDVPGWNQDADNAAGTIAVMDSGIDITHPDLVDSLYTFTEEQQAKYGCGPHGINMEPAPDGVDPKEYAKDITDHKMHGTHVAGIIAAAVNGFGVSGIAKGVKIFAVRINADDGEGQDPTDIIRGLEWLATVAKDVNLKAVNISMGSKHSQLAHTAAVNRLGELGVNVVYASGNETHNLDETVDMGAQNVSPYAINVDAEDMSGHVAPFSNYGRMTTDVCAPGSQILSTVPSVVERMFSTGEIMDYTNQTRVFLQNTDPAHIANGQIETFASETPEVKMYDSCPVNEDGTENKNAKEIGQRAQGPGLGFTDDTSWEVQVKSLSDQNDKYLSMTGSNSFSQNFWMAVPVEDGKDISWLSYSASLNDESNLFSGVATLLCAKKTSGGEIPAEMDMSIDRLVSSESSETEAVPRGISGTSAANLNGSMWSPCCLNIDSFIEQIQYVHNQKATDSEAFSEVEDPGDISGPYIWEKDGKKYILCRYATAANYDNVKYTDKTCFYLDDIAVTDEQAATGAYAYLSGSSMAAPMVTATLGIIAKAEPENGSLSDDELKNLALDRAGKLMAAVDYEDDLLEKCSTGGRINLHNTQEFDKKAPLFVKASEENGTLTLNGYFFGESGSLQIDGETVTPTQWTDQMITVDVSAYEPGAHVAMITNSDDRRRQIVFSVKGDLLFENDLSLPIDSPGFYEDHTDMMAGNLVGSGQYIFSLGTDGTKALKALWKYDTETDSWSRCADLPKAIRGCIVETNGMEALDGKLYLYLYRKQNEFGEKGFLYSYDINSDKWEKAFRKKLPVMGQIFRINDQLFFIDSESIGKLDIENGTISKSNIEMPDIEELEESKIAVSDNKVYLYGYRNDEDYNPIQCMYRLTYNNAGNSFTVEDLKEIAETITVEAKEMAMTGYEDGVFIVEPQDEADNRYDTYFVENSQKTANEFERSACYHKIYMPMALYTDGLLYVMGVNCTEPDTLFFRSTDK